MDNFFITNKPAPNKIISALGNRVTLNLAVPCDLDDGKSYELRLLQCSFVYCMPNVTSKNNLFKYTYNATNYTYNLPVGLYTLKSLNLTISEITQHQVNNANVFYFHQMKQHHK